MEGDLLRCTICPRMCVIKPGEKGFCLTKENRDGAIIDLTYGQLSSIAVDPIEKKPLFHFHPGSRSLSVSSVGCSFTCPWCQNWHISTAEIGKINTKHIHPKEVVDIARRQRCTTIAYTYNEPIINLNYLEDVTIRAHKAGVKNVLITNGYISKRALSRVVGLLDAANVDWKSFSPWFYREHCSGDLQSVLDATIEMKNRGVHVEVTFLIIPETNDSPHEVQEMARYIVENLGPDTPLHLSRFFPHHKFSHLPPTPLETLMDAHSIAHREGVKYVFIGNVESRGYDDTVCQGCWETVVRRRGYVIDEWHLDEDNNCEYCGAPIPIVGRREQHPS